MYCTLQYGYDIYIRQKQCTVHYNMDMIFISDKNNVLYITIFNNK